MMRWLALLFFLPGFSLATTTLPQGKVFHTPRYSAAIFSPNMFRVDDYPVFIPHARVDYWTPNRVLIDQFEAKLAVAMKEAQSRIPKGGFHAREYYTPKHFSADREKHIPDDIYTNEIYYWDPAEVAGWDRQYVGVTVDGKRALLANFPWSNFDGLSTQWFASCPAAPSIFFLVDKGELSFWPFGPGD
jgi:hypothetical protein